MGPHTLVPGRMISRTVRGFKPGLMVLDSKEHSKKALKKVLGSINGAMARSLKDNG
jgi:hypothetical protein